jgi:hypothetical protein
VHNAGILHRLTKLLQLATLFTIIFVTIVATCVKRYTLWKAQKGAALAKLEQLQASVSLTNTIKMIFLLRAFSWTSVALILVWSWYYLGSQAAQREYVYRQGPSQYHRTVFFQSATAPSSFSNSSDLSDVQITDIDSLFNSLLLNNVQEGHNLFPAPVIPLVPDAIPPAGQDYYSSSPDREGWYELTPGYQYAYSSYNGPFVYIVDLDPFEGRSSPYYAYNVWLGSFQISTSYIYVNCSQMIYGSYDDFPPSAESSYDAFFTVTEGGDPAAPSIDVWFRENINISASINSKCRLQQHFVDVKGNCDGTGCAVRNFRQTPGTNRMTPFATFQDSDLTQNLLEGLLLSDGTPTWNSSAISNALLFSGAWWENATWTNDDSMLSALAYDVSIGMTQLLNTYFSASQQAEPSGDEFNVEAIVHGLELDDIWVLGSGKGSIYNPEFHLSKPWLAIDIISCILLIAAAVSSWWLRRNTVAPDVFGYVSSMTRDNPHLPLPDGGTTMSGIDRARALKNVKVKITDLNTNASVGRIGLTVADDGTKLSRLDKLRHYV